MSKARRSAIALVLVSVAAVLLMAWPLVVGKRSLWRKATLVRAVDTGRGTRDWIMGLAFTAHGERVCVVDRSQRIRIYASEDLAKGLKTPLATFSTHGDDQWTTEEEVQTAAIATGGRRALVASRLDGVNVIDLATGKLEGKIKSDSILALAITPDGATGFFGRSELTEAEVWNLDDRSLERKITHDERYSAVDSVDLSPDTRRIVTGGGNHSVVVSELATGQGIARVELPGGKDEARFAGSDRWVCIFQWTDRGAVLWDYVTGERRSIDTRARVGTTACDHEGKRLVIGCRGEVVVWSTPALGNEAVLPFSDDFGIPVAIAVSPDDDAAVIGTTDGELLWLELPR